MKLILCLCLLLSGCAYNQITVESLGDVTINAVNEKPVSIDTLRQAEVPVSVVPK